MLSCLRYFLVLPLTLVVSSALSEPDSDAFARALNYNAFIKGSFIANSSDIQGKLAAGSDVSLHSYGVASSINLDAATPTLISGGNVSYSDGMVFQGSILASGSVAQVVGSVKNGMRDGAFVLGGQDIGIDFSSGFADLVDFSQQLSLSEATGQAEYKWGGVYLTGDCDSKVQVFSVDGSKLESASSLYFECVPQTSSVILNISGSSSGLSNIGLAHMQDRASQVLYNFHEALELSFFNVGIEGTVLAPKADVVASWGHIDGTIIAKSWNGPMELHNVPYSGMLPKGTASNASPKFISEPVTTINEGQSYSYKVVASDPDQDVLSYSIGIGPQALNINSAGLIEWATTKNDVGIHSVTVNVEDGQGGTASQSFDIEVVDVNSPPMIESIPVLSAQANSLYRYAVKAIDPDQDALTYTLTTAPKNMAIDPVTGLIEWNIEPGFAGQVSVLVSVEDGNGNADSQTFEINVTNNNEPPVASGLNLTTDEGLALDIALPASDPNDNKLSYTIISGPTNGSLSGKGKNRVYLPDPYFDGTDTFTFVVDDGAFESELATVAIIVTGSNQPPRITSTPQETLNLSSDLGVGEPQRLSDWDMYTNFPGNTHPGRTDWVFEDDGFTAYSKTNGPTSALVSDFHASRYHVEGTLEPKGGDDDLIGFILSFKNRQEYFWFSWNKLNFTFDIPGYNLGKSYLKGEADQVIERYYIREAPYVKGQTYFYSLDVMQDDIKIALWTDQGLFDAIILNDVEVGEGNFGIYVGSQSGTYYTVTTYPIENAGNNYWYDVEAVDPEGGEVTYSLLSGPEGAEITNDTGVLYWQAGKAEAGTYKVIVEAKDDTGLATTQEYNLVVSGGAPVITSAPITQGRAGQDYDYPVFVHDPTPGDTLTYSLVQGPVGMQMDPVSGELHWSPGERDVGQHDVVIEVADSSALTDRQSFTLNIQNTLSNQAPELVSAPLTEATVGRRYTYLPQLTDPDGDLVDYTLAENTPYGMKIVPGGQIQWVPSADQVTDHQITLIGWDEHNARVKQTFTLRVSGVGGNNAPSVISQPTKQVQAGQTYIYRVQADDPNGDSLAYELKEAPAGMQLDSQTGLIKWLTTETDIGIHDVTLSVSDGRGGYASQSYSLSVISTSVNYPPSITSTPELSVRQGKTYSYQIQAQDSESESLTYELMNGPDSVRVDLASGVLTWTPGADAEGLHELSIVVRDGHNNAAVQTWSVAVNKISNSAPVIESAPPPNAIVGKIFGYQVEATDADGDVLSYALDGAPSGMSINTDTGSITWLTSTEGSYSATVRVSDGEMTAEQSFTVVVEQAQLLSASVSVQPAIVDIGEQAVVTVQSFGASDDWHASLTLNGTPLVLDENNQAVITGQQVGYYQLQAQVTSGDEQALAEADLRVRDSSDTTAPSVSLDLNLNGSTLSAPTDIVGSVDDKNFAEYRLQLAPVGSEQFTDFAQGSKPVTNAVLGTFDPTLLKNGLYDIRLIASDINGQSQSVSTTVEVSGGFKVGQFSVSFDDLTVPLAGLPITITRTYDSRSRAQSGDFGFGWSIGYKGLRLQENITPGLNWQVNSYGGTFGRKCVESNGDRTVTVTMPSGEQERFRAKASPECSSIVSTIDVNLVYESLDGSGATLQQTDYGQLRLVNGNLIDLGNPRGAVDPQNYRLTTAEGMVYDLSQQFGVRQLSEPNGNSITFSDSGIEHSSGVKIDFIRDEQGRITAIKAPGGKQIRYIYASNGDLLSVTDRAGNTSTYGYDTGHYLQDIVDARGVRAVRNEYDDDGRLVAQVGPNGERIEFDHDIAGRTSVVRDALGYPTTYVYDDQGNVLQETNALGQTITRTYDDENNVLTKTNDLGEITSWTYDKRGNKLTETNALGETITYTYNSRNQLLTQTDSSGELETENVYDNNGNLVQLTDADGNITAIGYAANGNMTAMTDAGNNVIHYSYDASGNLATQTHPDGEVIDYTYDAYGKVLTEATSRTDAEGLEHTLVTGYVYDDNGNQVQTTDPLGGVTHTDYNSVGKVTAKINALGQRTEYEYDARGNRVATHYPDGTSTSAEYDANGNKISQTDPRGYTTSYVYDALNRQVKVLYPDGSETATEYDAAGRVTANIDANGNRTEYEYDATGHRTLVRDALGNETESVYDSEGRVNATIDARGHRTDYVYNKLGQRIHTLYADGADTAQTFDALGRRLTQTDQADVSTAFSYDSAGHLLTVTDALNQTTRYRYDEQGNKLTQTDAEGHTTSWEYDNLGRVTARTLPLGQRETKHYDAAGHLVSETDFNDDTTHHEYDAMGRRIHSVYSDGSEESFIYDNAGNRTEATQKAADATVRVTRYRYNKRNRLVQQIQPNGYQLDYRYDAAGNRTQLTITAPNGGTRTTDYGFDKLNRLVSVTDDTGTTSYSYDPVGNRTSVSNPNSTSQIDSYDALNRLTSLATYGPMGTLLERYDYSLSPTGQRTAIDELDGRSISYSYDALYRLTEETITDPVTGTRSVSYAYDKVGNRTHKTVDGAETVYAYDNNDRLMQAGLDAYTYDNNGNTLTALEDGVLTSYTYNSRNRMIKADTAAGTQAYRYNIDGIRTGANGTGFVVDSNRHYAQVLVETDAIEGEAVHYTYGDDLISQSRGGDNHFYHYDGLGSTRALSDDSGEVTDSYDYEAFGELLSQTGDTDNSYRFTGEQYDESLDQYYLRARYYDQGVGRFTQMDTWQGGSFDPASLHKYTYVHNSPMNNIDPSGNISMSSLGAGLSISFSLAGAGLSGYSIGNGGVAIYEGRYADGALDIAFGFMGTGVTTAGYKMIKYTFGPVNRAIRQRYMRYIATELPKKIALMEKQGRTSKAIADTVVLMRNSIKIETRAMMKADGLGGKMAEYYLRIRNKYKYGNSIGPTLKDMIKGGKSYDEVIESALRSSEKFNRIATEGVIL